MSRFRLRKAPGVWALAGRELGEQQPVRGHALVQQPVGRRDRRRRARCRARRWWLRRPRARPHAPRHRALAPCRSQRRCPLRAAARDQRAARPRRRTACDLGCRRRRRRAARAASASPRTNRTGGGSGMTESSAGKSESPGTRIRRAHALGARHEPAPGLERRGLDADGDRREKIRARRQKRERRRMGAEWGVTDLRAGSGVGRVPCRGPGSAPDRRGVRSSIYSSSMNSQ